MTCSAFSHVQKGFAHGHRAHLPSPSVMESRHTIESNHFATGSFVDSFKAPMTAAPLGVAAINSRSSTPRIARAYSSRERRSDRPRERPLRVGRTSDARLEQPRRAQVRRRAARPDVACRNVLKLRAKDGRRSAQTPGEGWEEDLEVHAVEQVTMVDQCARGRGGMRALAHATSGSFVNCYM